MRVILAMASPATVSTTKLIELLAPTLGPEKSADVVALALSRRRLARGDLQVADALVLLDDLAQSPGMVGIAARYAIPRVQSGSGPASGPASSEAPSSSRTRALTIELREIVELFSAVVGRAKSEEVVASGAQKLGLGARLDRTQALSLVELLAAEPGMVGLCARFAKARLILRFAA